jgi:hypothetical protein
MSYVLLFINENYNINKNFGFNILTLEIHNLNFFYNFKKIILFLRNNHNFCNFFLLLILNLLISKKIFIIK